MKHKSVLIISDLHIPYHHKDAFAFLKEAKKIFKPDTIINMGDLLDFHAISMHQHDSDLPSPGDELNISKQYIRELESVFPEVTEIHSNHSSLVYRRALKYGMSRQFLRPYGDFLGTKKWKWVDDLTLTMSNGDRVHFTHGKSANVLKVAQSLGMSVCQAHYHSRFSLEYTANPDKLYWGMQVGCLIDQKSLAFEYARNFPNRFILGTAVILDGVPRLLPMVLNNKGDWIGQVV